MKLLDVFKTGGYPNKIGPGCYDIHSARVPGVEELKEKIEGFMNALPDQTDIYINPVSFWERFLSRT